MQRTISALLLTTLLASVAAQAQATGAPVFAKLDANSDGKLSLNEASAHDALFIAFKKLDVNRDGELTQAEFAAYAP